MNTKPNGCIFNSVLAVVHQTPTLNNGVKNVKIRHSSRGFWFVVILYYHKWSQMEINSMSNVIPFTIAGEWVKDGKGNRLTNVFTLRVLPS